MSFVIVLKPPGPCNSSTGSDSAPGTPTLVNEGPMARTITLFGAFPVTIKPPIRALSPVKTRSRVEMLSRLVDGIGVAVAVAVGVGVCVGLGVGVCGVDVAVGVGV